MRGIVVVVGISLVAVTLGPASWIAQARADAPAAATNLAPADDRWPVRAGGPLTIDGGILLALPVALGTGLSTGLGAGAMFGRRLRVGLRASGSSATESSITWTVTHEELRLRAAAEAQHAAGRGAFGLRLGLGPTLVHEGRVRNQGARAGLTGSDLETTAVSTLPSLDLDAVVAVHVAGPWLIVLSGGPTWSVVDSQVKAGWSGLVGTGWQP